MIRTKENLAYIEKKQGKGSPYEVTQLINSFLGAMAHPWEEKEKYKWKHDSRNESDWPKINLKTCCKCEIQDTIGELVKFFRDGIAHGNIKYVGDGGEPEQIAEITIHTMHVSNTKTCKKGERRLEATVTVDRLREFLVYFVKQVQQEHAG